MRGKKEYFLETTSGKQKGFTYEEILEAIRNWKSKGLEEPLTLQECEVYVDDFIRRFKVVDKGTEAQS